MPELPILEALSLRILSYDYDITVPCSYNFVVQQHHTLVSVQCTILFFVNLQHYY